MERCLVSGIKKMMEQSKGNIHCTPDYGGQNAINGRKCRLWGYTDATGAVEYSYGDMSRPEWQNYVIVNVQRVSPSGIPYTISVKQMLPPYGDDPRDQMWIKKGFDYWKRNF